MDTYKWQLNKAVVDRLYYTERIWMTTWGFAALYTATNLYFVKRGYFTNLMRSRVAPIWAYPTAFNLVCTFIMIKPLRPEEIKHQMNKRIYMGKWLTSTSMLPLDEHGNIKAD